MNNFGAEKILIIDDLVDNLKFLASTLTKEGYQVRCAKNGEMALNALKNDIPDLILLDLKMPGMDGFQVCQKLKTSSQTVDIPIIFLTASDAIQDKIKAFQMGAIDYISKPFQIEEIFARINIQLTIKAYTTEINELNQQLEEKIKQRTQELEITNKKLKEEITHRIEAQLLAKKNEKKLQNILESLEEIVFSAQLPEFRFTYLNSAAKKVLGRKPQEFLDNPSLWFEIVHPEDMILVKKYTQIQSSFDDKTLQKVEFEYRIIQPSQEISWIRQKSTTIYDKNNIPVRIDGIIQDITEQKVIKEKLVYNALHDALTGLPNRNLFLEHLNRTIKQSYRDTQYSFAVLFLDMDRFKVINDSLGHNVGDELLIAFGNILQTCVRENDVVARLGGDEFIILLDGIYSLEDAVQVAERIQHQLKKPILLSQQSINTNASIGIVVNNKHHSTAEEILRDADLAMYRAKKLGRGCYAIFDQIMQKESIELLKLENDLRKALNREEFVLYYQPIFSLTTGKLTAFEALIRWQHPDNGLIFPDSFISLAEDTGMIVSIGEWVLKTACYQMKKWQEEFTWAKNLMINVNLSGKQIKQPNFIATIDQILLETAFDASKLNLEITESIILESVENIVNLFNQIRERKIKLSIDDFGTGYSSLSYLYKFPINTLKIDRSFIATMDTDFDKLQIVRTIINLAHTLGINVIGEGVANEKQLQQLKDLKCEEAQGYLFSKPLDLESTQSMLKKNYEL